jgi:hypothetical protein
VRQDRELLSRLLLKLEELPSRPGDLFLFTGHESELAIEGYSGDQIEYHLGILRTQGFIDSPGSQPMQGVTFRSLTPAGHDIVDQYRGALELQAAEKQAEESRKWISAAEAAALLKPVFNNSEHRAKMTICKRAHAGLIRARAEHFMTNKKMRNLDEIPAGFWYAEGEAALTQNWPTGDFDTWIERGQVHLEAFNVSFLRADIEKMIPAGLTVEPTAAPATPATPAAPLGGRPTADWWEDLIINICFKNFRGELQPKTQADVARAMHAWMTERGYEAADSTVRMRARKVWNAIQQDAES